MLISLVQYIWFLFTRAIEFPIALIIFPFAYLFRGKVYKYMQKPTKHKLNPCYLLHWFFSDEGKMKECSSPYWYKRQIKDKYFTEYEEEEKYNPIAKTRKQKWVKFKLAYKWCAVRNYMWNLHSEKNTEGKGFNFKVVKSPTSNYRQRPQLKYKDKDNIYRDNSGPYVRYSFEDDKWWHTTLEGLRILTFNTPNHKHRRFSINYVKLLPIPFIKRLFATEVYLGWTSDLGRKNIRAKFLFKKWDNKAKSDYKKYKNGNY